MRASRRSRPPIEAGAVRVQATAPMLDEFAAVLVRPHFALDAPAREAACARQRALVALHAPAPDCRLPCTDPDDRMFADLAVRAARRLAGLPGQGAAALRRIAARRFGVRIGTPEDWRAAGAAAPANPRL